MVQVDFVEQVIPWLRVSRYRGKQDDLAGKPVGEARLLSEPRRIVGRRRIVRHGADTSHTAVYRGCARAGERFLSASPFPCVLRYGGTELWSRELPCVNVKINKPRENEGVGANYRTDLSHESNESGSLGIGYKRIGDAIGADEISCDFG